LYFLPEPQGHGSLRPTLAVRRLIAVRGAPTMRLASHTSKWGSDGLILQLHAWEVEHHHGPTGDPSRVVGNGMLLWFEVDDFDAAVARARELDAPILLDVHRNPNANRRELGIRDPDGCTVVLASPDGDAKEA
jgi:hypothetical protein